ncbi:MAG: DUF4349 domain-containing protein [Maribacter sp.]
MNAKTVKQGFKILIVSFGLFYFSSCNQSEYSEKLATSSVDISEKYDALPESKSKDFKAPQLAKDLKIIKSANVKYKVRNVKIATNTIKQFAMKYNAYISDLRFENSLYSLENRFTIKIPQEHFDTMMDSIVEVAEFIDYENITTEDITERYIDLQTRLKTKLEVKGRYETILRKNAKTVEDILATEEKLRIIQEEIEAAQGKLKYLTNKVAYSTIQIDLYETVDYKEEPETFAKSFWSKSKDGLKFGWELIEAIVLGIIYIWPLIIIGLLLVFLLKKRLNKKRKSI